MQKSNGQNKVYQSGTAQLVKETMQWLYFLPHTVVLMLHRYTFDTVDVPLVLVLLLTPASR